MNGLSEGGLRSRVSFAVCGGVVVVLVLTGCGARSDSSACATTPVDPARQPLALAQAHPDSLSAYWRRWHSDDPHTALFTALADPNAEARRIGLWEAHRRQPEDSLPLWFLGLATWAERPLPPPDQDPWEALLRLNPDNGVVELATALRRAERGDIPAARMLFYRARGFPGGHAYTTVAEWRLRSFLSATRRLTGSDIGAGREILARAPLPPYRDWLDGLARIFLDPLQERPFDIRLRGWEASQGLRRLGRSLAVQARVYPGWTGLKQGEVALGLALEWRARQFLRIYAETFPDGPYGNRQAEAAQVAGMREEAGVETDLSEQLAHLEAAAWPGPGIDGDWVSWERVFDYLQHGFSVGSLADFTGSRGPDARLRETLLFRKLGRNCPDPSREG